VFLHLFYGLSHLMPKQMNIFSQRKTSAFKAVLPGPGPVAEELERGRTRYQEAAKELFELCYHIQVTGELPPPIALTEALIQFRQARADVETLNRQVGHACDEGPLVGVLVQPE
jgi:hypothetical protein